MPARGDSFAISHVYYYCSTSEIPRCLSLANIHNKVDPNFQQIFAYRQYDKCGKKNKMKIVCPIEVNLQIIGDKKYWKKTFSFEKDENESKFAICKLYTSQKKEE